MKVDPNGDIHIHQSDIETWLECQESFRRTLVMSLSGADESFESDAATVGTIFHAVADRDIEHPFRAENDVVEYARMRFDEELESYVAKQTIYARSSFKDDTAAKTALGWLAKSWFHSNERADLQLWDRDLLVRERSFDLPFLELPDGCVVHLAGTADLAFQGTSEMWDWKTASSMHSYQRWEKQRWNVQSTVYPWAMSSLGIIVPDSEGIYNFKFKVMVRAPKIVSFETIPVKRNAGNFSWLAKQVESIVTTVRELNIDQMWTLGDHSALCGPKWCPFWTTCKGEFIDANNDWIGKS